MVVLGMILYSGVEVTPETRDREMRRSGVKSSFSMTLKAYHTCL